MKLSALLLTFVIALGMLAPLEAKTKYKAPKAQHHTAQRAPKVRIKPAKVKPMKYRKAKRQTTARTAKAPKAHRVKRPKSV
jgi:hypothetical protein